MAAQRGGLDGGPVNRVLIPEPARPLSGAKKPTGQDVLSAARARVRRVFADFPNVYVSFSGGKDSGVLLDLAATEAAALGRRLGVLIVDLEAGYQATETFIRQMIARHADVLEVYWVALPINLRNAVSSYQPQWTCWDPAAQDLWVRQPPPEAITDPGYFDFFTPGMEFEQFTPAFGRWYAARHHDRMTACLVGIRSDESLNRYRTIAQLTKTMHDNLRWTTLISGPLYNAYPIYDWQTRDIWIYNGRTGAPYNHIYDLMHQAGISIHQARLCQPYGDDQKQGLWLYQILEPQTWAKVVARVAGAGFGARYARETGNILGRITITKPDTMTWQQYAQYLLDTMPPDTAEHFRDKIAWFVHWYSSRGYPQGRIPDAGHMDKSGPSWQRVCRALLKYDYWCKEFAMAPPKNQGSYAAYRKRMQQRRSEWQYDGTL